LARRLERKRYACSAITFYVGLKRTCGALATQHSVFVAADYRAGFDALFDPRIRPRSFHFYVNAPARTDPGAVPAGRDALQIIVPAANVHAGGGQDFESLKANARAYVLGELRKLGAETIEADLDFESSRTPENWRDDLNLERGSTFGSLAHDITQVGCFRPDNRHPRYGNLFFVGGSTRPGSGVPMVLISAMLTAERVTGGRLK
jgi:phytoene desaturase